MRIVAIGGGHGLSATVAAARHLGAQVTAVVSMADDGGSSGRLRREFAVLPPGDLRMALLALADPGEQPLSRLLAHRFEGDGPVGGHSLGNLMLAALWQQGTGVVESLRELGALLRVSGEVLPVATTAHSLVADVRLADGSTAEVTGQAQIAALRGAITRVRTVPESVSACPEALAAITEADLIVLGPGSWFTSVLAPLCISGVSDAIAASAASVVLVANLHSGSGESVGFTTQDYLQSLYHEHPHIRVDAVIEPASWPPVAVTGVGRIPYAGTVANSVHTPELLAECLSEVAVSLREGQRGRP